MFDSFKSINISINNNVVSNQISMIYIQSRMIATAPLFEWKLKNGPNLVETTDQREKVTIKYDVLFNDFVCEYYHLYTAFSSFSELCNHHNQRVVSSGRTAFYSTQHKYYSEISETMLSTGSSYFLVSITGQVESAWFPDHDDLYCRLFWVCGQDWVITAGQEEGVSQVIIIFAGKKYFNQYIMLSSSSYIDIQVSKTTLKKKKN